jgi:hypothetical protein
MADKPKQRPIAPAHARFLEEEERLRHLGLAERFLYIYGQNLWGSLDSASGPGSVLETTAVLRAKLPGLLSAVGARTLLDIPCGDFGWLSLVDLPIDRYIGADIVPAIVEQNTKRHAGTQPCIREFRQLDLTRDALPRADVVLCRDCLVHLSFANVRAAFDRLRESGSTRLLATTFLEHDVNEEIADGDWRMLNLERPPFNLPRPEAVLVEECSEQGGAYADKALGLWRIADL